MEIMRGDVLEKYDFSGYPFNHPLYSAKNKKIIGMMKDKKNMKTILDNLDDSYRSKLVLGAYFSRLSVKCLNEL